MNTYSEADQRADTAFLVGVTHGRDVERGKVVAALEKHKDCWPDDPCAELAADILAAIGPTPMSVFAVTGLTIRPDANHPHHNSTHPTETEALTELARLRDAGLIHRTASTVYQLPDDHEETDA